MIASPTCPPVLLFAFRRPAHFARCWKSLAANSEAEKTELHVFLDGAKGAEDKEAVVQTWEESKKIEGFRKVHVHRANKHLGLSASILGGIQKAKTQSSSWIVLEDDLVVSPYFLSYMHAGLRIYQDDPRVASVHGFVYPVGRPLPETFFLKGADCWGWGSWNRAWRHFESDGKRLRNALVQSRDLERFTFSRSAGFLGMLEDQISGKNDSWAVRWYAAAFLKDMYTLYPGKSLVQNIGLDSSGAHCGNDPSYEISPSNERPVVRPIPVEDCAEARQAFEAFFRRQSGKGLRHRLQRIWAKIIHGVV